MSKEKLWIVTELFYPEITSTAFILTEIAKKMTSKYEVHVLCGNPTYDTDSSNHTIENIFIHRINDKKIDKNNKVKRVIRAVTLSKKMMSYLNKNINNVDRLLIVTNPIFLLLDITKWANKYQKKLTLLVHDIFPENALATNVLKFNTIGKLLKIKFDKAYSSCTEMIAIGRDMKNVLSKKTGKKDNIHIITNWSNIDEIKPDNIKREGKLVIQFAGNLGRVQGLLQFFNILKKVDNQQVEFVFVGSGALKKNLELFVKENNITNIKLLPPYKRNEEQIILNNCDIALITLHENMYGLGVPSKMYNNLAAGKPILYIGPEDSEIYLEVKENDIGYCFTYEQEQNIIEFINSLTPKNRRELEVMGNKSREIAETVYNKDLCLEQFFELL